jgi:hypothetical protein
VPISTGCGTTLLREVYQHFILSSNSKFKEEFFKKRLRKKKSGTSAIAKNKNGTKTP